ncbi:polymorphic toxin type 44 domain-containing protein [Bacillus arachidis]|uniref:polymorphic toxin type 44 domain-containing protein n=1 Tax=Bacillus arachidis TaxID=2819290 RepID=UPI00255C410B|nr:polymorphic toxin type 44 domain-containing protein [Bacillus arachidis]WIY58773.1 polymorphic toxin type 44 domain-containing protein [Bacillus arachidis]
MWKKSFLISCLLVTFYLSSGGAVSAQTIPSNEMTSSFSYILKRNALIMAYAAEEAKEEGTYPWSVGLAFAEKVKPGGEWDYKTKFGRKKQFICMGYLMKGEDLGNIHFGYVARAATIPIELIATKEGAYQIWYDEKLKGWADSYFDQPSDETGRAHGVLLWDNKLLPNPQDPPPPPVKPFESAKEQPKFKALTIKEKTEIKADIQRISKELLK